VIDKSNDNPHCFLNGLVTSLKAKNSLLMGLEVVHYPFLLLIQAFVVCTMMWFLITWLGSAL